MPNRYCWLLATKQTAVSVWHMPAAVCTVLNSWWWTERPPETRRVLFKNKINWENGASCWIYYRNTLRFTAIWTLNCNTVKVLKYQLFCLARQGNGVKQIKHTARIKFDVIIEDLYFISQFWLFMHWDRFAWRQEEQRSPLFEFHMILIPRVLVQCTAVISCNISCL